MNYFDITIPIKNHMTVYEGDPDVYIEPFLDLRKGDPCNLSSIQMGSHTGTHIDAPNHFFRNGRTVDEIPLDTLMGPCRVILIRNERVITRKLLQDINLDGVERLVIKTDHSYLRDRYTRFRTVYVHLDVEAAGYLVNLGVKLVGIDSLSVEEYGAEDNLCHKILLGAGIVILEWLNLRDVDPGDYDLICLPLKVYRGDGAPARVVLRGK